MKSGIAVAGNILVDKINEISAYPQSGELTQIHAVVSATGGLVPNVAVDLKRLHPALTVKAVGKVGVDSEGEFAKKVLEENGVETACVKTADIPTSFTQVMSVVGGQRTFFTYAGASADFGANDVDFDALNVKMFHLGYFLLLKKMDEGDGVKTLKKAKEAGVETSIDLVSENSTRYQAVLPCLPYTDNLIINEIEAGHLTGMQPTAENLRAMAEKLMRLGVRKRVIIHMVDVGVCLSENGFFYLPSYQLPKGFIKGTTGAGDAFCAGALLGIYQEKSEMDILRLATISATGALMSADAISGMKSVEELQDICKNLERKNICL